MTKSKIEKRKIEKKQQALLEEQRSDLLINRMMIIFAIAVIGVCSILFLKRDAMTLSGISPVEVKFVMRVLPALTIVAGLLFAAAVAYFIVRRVKAKPDGDKLITSAILLGITATLFFVTFFYKQLGGLYAMLVMIAVTLAYFVYCLYSRDFFVASALAFADAFLLMALRSFPSAASVIALILIAISSAAAIILALSLRKNGGSLKLGGKKVSILPSGAKYYPTITIAVMALAFALLALVLAEYVLYCVIVLLAAFLLFGIVYTVKMM